MKKILDIDPRFGGKKSNEWAKLLHVTDPAVRQWDTWKLIQKARRSGDHH
jgi:hypothetical protein